MAHLRKMQDIVISRGTDSLNQAKNQILLKCTNEGYISQALQHFTKFTLGSALPIFPALISLSCEAAGGNAKATTGIGAAILMIAGAADIHDDVIDKSKSKGVNLTVYGKYGKEIAILAGDSLLVYGMRLLEQECNTLSKDDKDRILDLVSVAYSEISAAEAIEMQIKGNVTLPPKVLYEVIKLKAAITELNTTIGAIIAHADENVIENLGQFGRNLGILSTVAEEYGDLLTYKELQNRLKHECPPLPFLYAMSDSSMKQQILPLIGNSRLRLNDFKQINKLVLSAKVVQQLTDEMLLLAEKENNYLGFIKNEKVRVNLMIFSSAALAFLQDFSI